ncbi:unnamed protein product, partial [Ectocarpus sp. 6 AP-2014]
HQQQHHVVDGTEVSINRLTSFSHPLIARNSVTYAFSFDTLPAAAGKNTIYRKRIDGICVATAVDCDSNNRQRAYNIIPGNTSRYL